MQPKYRRGKSPQRQRQLKSRGLWVERLEARRLLTADLQLGAATLCAGSLSEMPHVEMATFTPQDLRGAPEVVYVGPLFPLHSELNQTQLPEQGLRPEGQPAGTQASSDPHSQGQPGRSASRSDAGQPGRAYWASQLDSAKLPAILVQPSQMSPPGPDSFGELRTDGLQGSNLDLSANNPSIELQSTRLSDSGDTIISRFVMVDIKAKPPEMLIFEVEEPIASHGGGLNESPGHPAGPGGVHDQPPTSGGGMLEAEGESNLETGLSHNNRATAAADVSLLELTTSTQVGAEEGQADSADSFSFSTSVDSHSGDYQTHRESLLRSHAFQRQLRSALEQLKSAADQQAEVVKLEDLLQRLAEQRADSPESNASAVLMRSANTDVIRRYVLNLNDAMIVTPIATTQLADDYPSEEDMDMLTDAWTSRFGLASVYGVGDVQAVGLVAANETELVSRAEADMETIRLRPLIASATSLVGASLLIANRFRRRAQSEADKQHDL